MGDVREVLLIEQAQRLGKLWAWLRWLIGPVVLTVVVGVALMNRRDTSSCSKIVRAAPGQASREVCEAEYRQTGSPIALRGYVDSLIALKDLVLARAFASAELATSQHAVAWRQLGECSRSQQLFDRSIFEIERSYLAGKITEDSETSVRALNSLQRTYFRQGRFARAFETAEKCIKEAKEAKIYDLAFNCHLSAANAAAQKGASALAERQLQEAEDLLPQMKNSLDARTTLAYTTGNIEQETVQSWGAPPHDQIAANKFGEALALNILDQQPDLNLTAYQNRAFSFARLNQIRAAREYLMLARRITTDEDSDNRDQNDVLEAYIDFRDGKLEQADARNRELFNRLDVEARLGIAQDEAQIALQRSDPVEAERWVRRGIESAEATRRTEGVVDFPSLGISNHRALYDLLFRALIEQHRDREALFTMISWQTRSMPAAIAASAAPRTLQEAVGLAEAFGAWLPAATTVDSNEVSRTLSRVDLLAFFVIEGDVWSIVSLHGVVRSHRVGTYQDVSNLISSLATEHVTTEPALAAGRRLLPPEVYRQTSDTLYVSLDGRLASLPVLALRRTDGLLTGVDMRAPALLELRPVVRLLRLPKTNCEPVPFPRRVLALANAQGDLPESERDIDAIRNAGLDVAVFTGVLANRTALRSVRPGDALHIATHAGLTKLGGDISLADGSIPAVEIASWKLDVPVAVLSACATGQSAIDDINLDGSLAGALLLAGTRRVVGTQRPVLDSTAAEFSAGFYAHGGLRDPIRATREAQLALLRGGNWEWPLFNVFVGDVCSMN